MGGVGLEDLWLRTIHKAGGPTLVTSLNGTLHLSGVSWGVDLRRSSRKHMCLKRDYIACTEFCNYCRFDSQHSYGTGWEREALWLEGDFSLWSILNTGSIWTLEIMREMAMLLFGFANHLISKVWFNRCLRRGEIVCSNFNYTIYAKC